MAKSAIPNHIQRRAPRGAKKFYRSATTVRRFLNSLPGLELSQGERARIVQQAIMLLESFHVNLPLKTSMYAVDPVRRLRLLQLKLDNLDDDHRFHREMTQIFNSLNDIHTHYLLPVPFNDHTAWLPFAVEFCLEDDESIYLATKVREEFFTAEPRFRQGVEVVTWNGMPIERAVELFGAQSPSGAGNSAARHAHALFMFTQRPLLFLPPPDEEWVVVGYRTGRRAGVREVKVPWLVSHVDDVLEARPGGKLLTGRIREHRRQLFAEEKAKDTDWVAAEDIPTTSGKFGYLRIFTFDVGDSVEEFIDEVITKVDTLTRRGLIIDVRGNEGGRTRAAELLLQLFSPDYPQKKRIEPQRCCLLNTPHTLRLCELQRSNERLGPEGLRPWIESVDRAVQTGAKFSANFPITDPEKCNDPDLITKGRLYPGPVIVITDGLSASAAEIFAAGFQDHGGFVLGVGPVMDQKQATTAGAGANVRRHSELREFFKNARSKSPFRRLPHKADFDIPFRRFQRVHDSAGMEIEDFGVIPDETHVMTRVDITRGNKDLKNRAGKLLLEIAADNSRTNRSNAAKRSKQRRPK
jgi:hypothetical protein